MSRYNCAMRDDRPLRVLADRVLEGKLDELLCRWADAGISIRAASQFLALELGVAISRPTVQKWTAEALEARAGESNGEAA